jgi:pimeloyl-ACP methyl ester carboxylesterase
VQIYKIIGGPSQSTPDELLYEMAKRTVQRSNDTDGRGRQFVAAHATGSLKGLLRGIRAPTLLIHGSDDPLIPARRSQQLHRGIRGSKLMILNPMGHNLPRPLIPRMIDAIVANCLQTPPQYSAGGA